MPCPPVINLSRSTGIGLKPEYFQEIIETKPDIGFFEIHAENYMVAGGPFHFYLERIRQDYPLSIHGVGLSIGGKDDLDQKHLSRLADLIDRYQPELFSEHLAWSSHQGVFFNDLLPIPYTQKTLQQVCDHLNQTQDYLKRNILLENPSTYIQFYSSTYSEPDFLCEVIKRTGCGLLLDVNNLFVSCSNHSLDPIAALHSMPIKAVEEIHLAGFSIDLSDQNDIIIIDSHDSDIADEVWALYKTTIELTGILPTLIERDQNIPALQVLLAEAQYAQDILNQRVVMK